MILLQIAMMSPGQRAKKVVSDSPGLVDVAIGLSEWQAVEMTFFAHWSWDSSCKESRVPVQNHRVPVQKTMNSFGPLCIM